MQNIKEFLHNLTNQPGAYQMLGAEGEVLYVGKAKNLKKRIASYFNNQSKDSKTHTLIKQIKNIDITVTASEYEALLLECNLIKKHKPRYNILLRDDKSYPFIFISNHAYPRIDFYRGKRKKDGKYFGPYPSAYAVREAIQLLQKLFKIRTCRDSFYESRSRPCLLFQIGRCTGPCINLISQEDYAKQIELAILFLEGKGEEVVITLQKLMQNAAAQQQFELAANYRDQIVRLRQIQHKQYVSSHAGELDVLGWAMQAGIVCVQLLSIRKGQVIASRAHFPIMPTSFAEEEIFNAFLAQYYLRESSLYYGMPKQIVLPKDCEDKLIYEQLLSKQSNGTVKLIKPHHGEKKKFLDMAMQAAKQSLAAHLVNKTNIEERMNALQQVLNLATPIKRIECFDVSHHAGEATVASCIVFNAAGPVKSDYRRFNISNISAGDDVAAMKQVILRRFKKMTPDKEPTIVMIDGGKTQLQAAQKVLQELGIHLTCVMSISKGIGRKPGYETLHFLDKSAIHLASDAIALHLIQHVRDEAHRFAIMGHRGKRDKQRRQSILETIDGIGVKKRRELLRYFGGIQGVAHASLEELTKVPGISYALADKLFAVLHDT